MELDAKTIRYAVASALAEDVGAGDVTSLSVVPGNAEAEGRIVFREDGVVAGLPVAEEVFRQLSPSIVFKALVGDGADVAAGECAASVRGPARAILTGERTALNFLQRLSGTATLTRRCVQAVSSFRAKILDTRKTTPGLRALEKYAVRTGGGANHRFGLYDQALIKDNHLRALLPEAGSLPGAVRMAVSRAREKVGSDIKVEVEAESLDTVRAAIEASVDIIMLDNMTLDEMRRACDLVAAERKRTGAEAPVTEASGGLTMEKLAAVAATGVDAISLGALTHSARALDIGMDFASRDSGLP